ncbi:protein BatD [Dyella solisilvae]|uniref:Protein BatD n=1 Tax=Dyella solisilvae TaxID=1920168 RepID=A0A370K756_9GAMM|nr:BatD family protein [Dyella solisilvae]RDI98452.1 protein BatD [Dyella solisilvae]
MRHLFTVLWLLVAWSPLSARAADVQATLDRTRVSLGETVTLNLRVNGGGMVQTPDLSALSKDFAVLGTSSNSSISIVNGARSAQVTIGVALRPLHVGTLQIPPLPLAGGVTAPLNLEVVAPDPSAAADGRKDVFLEAQVDPVAGYVGQQRVYTVRLYFAADLTNGSLEDPQLAGVDAPRLGNEINYQAERGGRRYNVIERRYALIPQREGHLVIPPVAFQGDMVDMADPDAFFGHSTPVSAASPAVSLDARPAPAGTAQGAWLPAREIALKLDGGPGGGELRVGQPLNLVMSLQATGLPYEALPALSMPALDGATVYPDKPVNGTHVDGQWLQGRRQQGFAVVPSRAGTLTIPETTLHWWNVVTDRPEVARIPAQTFTVLPATAGATNPPPATTAAPVAPATVPASAPSPTTISETPWRWIALGSLGLWVLSVVLWWRRRRARVVPTQGEAAPSSPSHLRAAFLAAARGGDEAAKSRSLLAWARAERPALQNLGELAEALASEPQCASIAALQRRLYAEDEAPRLNDQLADAFRGGFAWRPADGVANASPLPPLYPFNLER